MAKGTEVAGVRQRLCLFPGFDVGCHDALKPPVQPAVDLVRTVVGHPGLDRQTVGMGDRHDPVHLDRTVRTVLAVQAHAVEAGQGGQLNPERLGGCQPYGQGLAAFPVALEDRVLKHGASSANLRQRHRESRLPWLRAPDWPRHSTEPPPGCVPGSLQAGARFDTGNRTMSPARQPSRGP